MKISEIKGERVLDVLADITGPALSIAADEQAAKLFTREKCPEGTDPRTFMLNRIKDSLPPLLKRHKQDIISIMATLEDVEPEEYAKDMTLASLTSSIVDMITDEELLAFFR